MMQIGSYDYDNLIESYLVQDKQRAKTAGNRLWYEGNLLYSYNTILSILHTHKDKKVLLINKSLVKYSQTTTRHMNILIEKSKYPTFIVKFSRDDVEKLHSLIDTANDTFEKMKRARSRKSIYAKQFIQEVDKAIDFAELFEIKNKNALDEMAPKFFIALAYMED